MKEINTKYHYSAKQIQELTKDKTEVEMKKVLGKEIDKNKKE